jgi:hypothetical protein
MLRSRLRSFDATGGNSPSAAAASGEARTGGPKLSNQTIKLIVALVLLLGSGAAALWSFGIDLIPWSRSGYESNIIATSYMNWAVQYGDTTEATVAGWFSPERPAAGESFTLTVLVDTQLDVDNLQVEYWLFNILDFPPARQEVVPLSLIEGEGEWTTMELTRIGPGEFGVFFSSRVPRPPGRNQLVLKMQSPEPALNGILVGPLVGED